MELPVIDGVIDRRILVNYRVHPDIVRRILPPSLEPWIVNGYASAGICLLRLTHVGLKHSPSILRIRSENAAHRFLVSYRTKVGSVYGVYIPRRDTDSLLNVFVAGKVFSWPHCPATFQVNETAEHYSVQMQSDDGHSFIHVEADLSADFPSRSMFDSLEHASGCFYRCSIGVSPSVRNSSFKMIELKTDNWSVRSLSVQTLTSSYFENESVFPKGSIEFDNALLMTGIDHEWKSHSQSGAFGICPQSKF